MRKIFVISILSILNIFAVRAVSPYTAYTVYNASDFTLTFYFDNMRASRTGTTFDLNTGNSAPGWSSVSSNIKHVVFDENFSTTHPTSTYRWFAGCSNLEDIFGLEFVRTDEVINMAEMFSGCSKLTNIEITGFQTGNVTDMGSMFYNCQSLVVINVGSFDVQKVTNMDSMFEGCSSLEYIRSKTSWNTITSASGTNMFLGCSNLKYKSYNASSVDIGEAVFDYSNGYFSDYPREVYAVYYDDKLTFYYDYQKATRPGLKFNMNEGSEKPIWFYKAFGGVAPSIDSGIKMERFSTYSFDSSFKEYYPTTTAWWLTGCCTIENLGNLSTDWVENMHGMFAGNNSYSLDLRALVTERVTDMGEMFIGCESHSLNLSSFDTSKVIDMGCMFQNCSYLTSLDLSSFNTSKVTNMSCMFSGSSLATLDVSHFNTSKVKNMSHMFAGMQLVSLNLSNFDTSNVENMCGMFSGCYDLVSIDVSSFNTANVTNMNNMFSGCEGFTTLDLNRFNTNKVTDMESMFDYCQNVETLTITDFRVDGNVNVNKMFYRCPKLQTIICDGIWTTTNSGAGYNMFSECTSLVGGTGATYNSGKTGANYAHPNEGGYFTSNSEAYVEVIGYKAYFYCDSRKNDREGNICELNTGSNKPGWWSSCGEFYIDPTFIKVHPTSTYEWFGGASKIEGLQYLNTDEVLTMECMFIMCDLQSLDLSHFNTAKVTNMSEMFAYSISLKSINLSSFNTENVESMLAMFFDCNSLESINLSSFDTSNVTDMMEMFFRCSSLKTLDLSNFNTSKVTRMTHMFQFCSNLKGISLNSFQINADTDIGGLFKGCEKLQYIDMSETVFNKDVMYITDQRFYETSKLPYKTLLYLPKGLNHSGNNNINTTDGVNFYCNNYVMSDSIGLGIPHPFECTSASFTRTGIAAGAYSTLCLPFDFTATPECTFYRFTGVGYNEDDKVWEATVTETNTMKAHTPYIFKTPTDVTEVTFQGNNVTMDSFGETELDVKAINATIGNDKAWTFKGTYDPLDWTQTDPTVPVYGFASAVSNQSIEAGTFVRFVQGASLAPYRARLIYSGTDDILKSRGLDSDSNASLPAYIRVRIVKSDDKTTGIESLRNGSTNEKWTTLNGIRLQKRPTQKGIYIFNGHKVVVK